MRRCLPTVRNKVLLVDFVAYDPPESTLRTYVEQAALEYRSGFFKPETVDTMVWLHESAHNAVGDRTAVAPGLRRSPMDNSYSARMEEAHLVMFGVAAKAMSAAAVTPREVDILITVSGFASTPSLSSAVACKFAMRSDVKAFSLSGHGCAGGLVGIELAQALLSGSSGTLALLVMSENITNGMYTGNELPFLPSNILFTVGGAAAVLSTRRRDRARAKYELQHTARHLTTKDEKANSCVGFRDDKAGRPGVFIDTDVLKVAAVSAISSALRRLGPRVLPWSEMAKVARNKKYAPNFSTAFQHLAVHPGALPVIKKVAAALRFSSEACQPSLATLERFGNTSCSSTFYVLAHIEHHKGVKRGEKVMQLAMGTGFKCVAATWRARRTHTTHHAAWAPSAVDFRRHPAGWARPRAIALAAAQEAAEHGADAPLARALAAHAAAVRLGPDGLEVADCAAKRAAEAVGGDRPSPPNPVKREAACVGGDPALINPTPAEAGGVGGDRAPVSASNHARQGLELLPTGAAGSSCAETSGAVAAGGRRVPAKPAEQGTIEGADPDTCPSRSGAPAKAAEQGAAASKHAVPFSKSSGTPASPRRWRSIRMWGAAVLPVDDTEARASTPCKDPPANLAASLEAAAPM